MKVNKITSVHTQLPYSYYSLPVCKPVTIEDAAENLGEVLSGDSIENSLYELNMKRSVKCKILCKREYSADDVKNLQGKIKDAYRAQWIIDNIPAAVRVPIDGADFLDRGLPIGVNDKDNYFLFNHVKFKISYHSDPTSFEGSRIVAFLVQPVSVKHTYDKWPNLKTCPVTEDQDLQTINGPGEVVWTYDVEWNPSPVKWASRWDVFFQGTTNDQIHWFSIVNSLMIVLFLTGMVALIVIRALHKDIARYNEELLADEAQEETGWKLVHGEVFRPPSFSPMLLSVLVGSGAQIFVMAFVLLFFAILGFLSPANRGGLMTAMLLLYCFMASFAGYTSAIMYKMFGGKKWKRNTLMAAMLHPGVAFGVVFTLNLFVWHEEARARFLSERCLRC